MVDGRSLGTEHVFLFLNSHCEVAFQTGSARHDGKIDARQIVRWVVLDRIDVGR